MKNYIPRNAKLFTIFFFSCFLASSLNSQTKEQLDEITRTYDKEKIELLGSEIDNLEKDRLERVDRYIKRTGAKRFIRVEKGIKKERDDLKSLSTPEDFEPGKEYYLYDVLHDGSPLYYTTENQDAAKSTRISSLNTGGFLGLDLNGENMRVAVIDGGRVRGSHEKLKGKTTWKDDPNFRIDTLSSHATHVTGTIIGKKDIGPAEATGMAPLANADIYTFRNGDAKDYYNIGKEGLLQSNHSYGFSLPKSSSKGLWFLGYYDDRGSFCRLTDKMLFTYPYLTSSKSAGNEREDASSTYGYERTRGFGILTGSSNAKNNIVVAATEDLIEYNNPMSVMITGFSSFGPPDDGRIKPDIAGNGRKLLSSYSSGDSKYRRSNGTSMSAPNISGGLLLLQEHYNNLNNKFMKSATVKALVLGTALEAGVHKGPDYKFGWGVLNAEKAAEVITHDNVKSRIIEEKLNQGDSYSIEVEGNGGDLVVTLVWTDPAGVIDKTQTVDNRKPALINDLDLRVTGNGKTYMPWKLDPENPSYPATQGDNIVDNVEKVEIPKAKGKFTITVSHKGKLKNDYLRPLKFQDFSLVAYGFANKSCAKSKPTNIKSDVISPGTVRVSWDGDNKSSYMVEYKIKGLEKWLQLPVTSSKFIDIYNLMEDTEYQFRIKSVCSSGDSEFLESTFKTIKKENCNPRMRSNPLLISEVEINDKIYENSNKGHVKATDFIFELDSSYTVNFAFSIVSISSRLSKRYLSFHLSVDLNKNGIFDDEGENIFFISGELFPANGSLFGSYTFPPDLSIDQGVYDLRLIAYIEYDTTSRTRCGFIDGGVIDFSLSIPNPTLTIKQLENEVEEGGYLTYEITTNRPFLSKDVELSVRETLESASLDDFSLFMEFSLDQGDNWKSIKDQRKIIFPANTDTVWFRIPTIDDSLPEKDEAFSFEISSRDSLSLVNSRQYANIKDNDSDELVIYPNPFSDVLNISYELTNILGLDVLIYNETGRVVYQNRFRKKGKTFKVQLNLSYLFKGFYVIVLKTDIESKSYKILKQ